MRSKLCELFESIAIVDVLKMASVAANGGNNIGKKHKWKLDNPKLKSSNQINWLEISPFKLFGWLLTVKSTCTLTHTHIPRKQFPLANYPPSNVLMKERKRLRRRAIARERVNSIVNLSHRLHDVIVHTIHRFWSFVHPFIPHTNRFFGGGFGSIWWCCCFVNT